MPYLYGCELGSKVNELNGSIKVILIGAYDSMEDNKHNFEFHRKPVTLQKILDIVNVSLNDIAQTSLSKRLDEI